MEIAIAPDLGHVPPVTALFLQRKFAGMYSARDTGCDASGVIWTR